MRRISLNIQNFVTSYLPSHKRQSNRLSFLFGICEPFRLLEFDYRTWRETVITRARVTGETASIAWYLNSLFDPLLKRIEILTAGVSGIPVALASEVAPYMTIGLDSEPSDYEAIPLMGEDGQFGTFSFIVQVPTALSANQDAIRRIVNIYRTAGKDFKIVLF